MECSIRPFGGSLAEAQGVLAVERATFHESPYSAEALRIMLAEGPQRAWVAMNGQKVVGFVVAFRTNGLSGPCWEIDLLAVHPAWRGHGLAIGLVQAATSYGSRVAPRARAVVATDNRASATAFTRAGFRAGAENHDLLVYRPQDMAGGPEPTARFAQHRHRWQDDGGSGVTVQQVPSPDNSDATLLQAEADGHPAGLAELIEVQTVLYRGFWIESLRASSRTVREALVHHTLERAGAQRFDEVGAMVPRHDWRLKDALLGAGFFSLGEFRWFTARLLPRRPRMPKQAPEEGEPDATGVLPAGGRMQDRHV